MYTIIKCLDFCYGHRLLDYDGKCSRLHGHNAVLEVEIASPSLDSAGMVRDFSEVKAQVGAFVEAQLDHRMLLRRDDPAVVALQAIGENPFLMDCNPTAENIARLIFEECRKMELPVSGIGLWETPKSRAEYRAPVTRTGA